MSHRSSADPDPNHVYTISKLGDLSTQGLNDRSWYQVSGPLTTKHIASFLRSHADVKHAKLELGPLSQPALPMAPPRVLSREEGVPGDHGAM